MNIFHIIVLCMGVSGGLSAASSEAADALYGNGHWEQALSAYKNEQDFSAGRYLRMGECALKGKKYAEGLAYWHKALQGVYWLLYYEVARKIVLVEAEIGIRTNAILTPQWYVVTTCASVPPLVWQLIGVLLLLFFLWRMRVWYVARRWMAVVGMGLLLSAVGSIAWWSITYRQSVGGVISASAKMHTGPDVRFNEIGVFSLGTPVQLLQKAQIKEGPVYYKVYGRGRIGWVASEPVHIL